MFAFDIMNDIWTQKIRIYDSTRILSKKSANQFDEPIQGRN